MKGNRKRPSLNDEDESPCSKYRRLDIFEESRGQQASSDLNWAASSSTSSPVAINDIQDVIYISSDSEEVSTIMSKTQSSY